MRRLRDFWDTLRRGRRVYRRALALGIVTGFWTAWELYVKWNRLKRRVLNP